MSEGSYRPKNKEFMVQGGDLKPGIWTLSDDLITDGKTKIKISKLMFCTIEKDEHKIIQAGTGRIAGGIVGAALLGPIGALGGLLAGGKKRVDETIINCGFDDGRVFSAECTQTGATDLRLICLRNSIESQKKQSDSNFEAPKLGADDVECTQCAELITSRAKMCRFCGADRTSFGQLSSGLENYSKAQSGFSIGPYVKFLTDYRAQVKDSPFETDQEIIGILEAAMSCKYENIGGGQSKFKADISENLSLGVGHIDKIYSAIWPAQEIIDKFHKDPISKNYDGFGNADLLEILRAISECRLEKDFESIRAESDAVIKLLGDRSERVVDPHIVLALRMALPTFICKGAFYFAGDFLIGVDPDTRKQIEISNVHSTTPKRGSKRRFGWMGP